MPSITLHLPSVEERDTLFSYINSFNKPEVVKVMAPLMGRLKKLRVSYTSDTPDRMRKMMNGLCSSFTECANKLKKAELVEVAASFGSDDSNIAALANADTDVGLAWRLLIFQSSVSYSLLAKCLEASPVISENPYHYSSNVLIDLVLDGADIENIRRSFSSRGNGADRYVNSHFWISQARRKSMARKLLPPESLQPFVFKNLPRDEKLKIENFEGVLSREVVYLSGLYSSGLLPAAGTNLTATLIKSIVRKLKPKEFSDGGKDEMVTRSSLLILAYVKYVQRGKSDDGLYGDIDKFSKYVYKKLGEALSGTNFSFFFPQYVGFTTSWAATSRAGKIAEYVQSLLMPAAGGWLNLSNFKLRYMCGDNLLSSHSAYTSLFTDDARRKATIKRKGDSNYYSPGVDVDWFDDILFPFVVGWIKLLCSCGILEMAVEEKRDPHDIFDGIKYVRLTPLGRYAFDIDKTYKSSEAKNVVEMFDVDPAGVVTILQANCPYEAFLQRIGTNIGGRRYKVTAASIVAANSDSKSVEEDITRIKTIFCHEPKGYWKQTLEEARLRCKSTLPKEDRYYVVALNPEVPGLIEFVSTHRDIREKCVRAEGMFLLVPLQFFDDFSTLMHKEGYLV